MAYKSNFGHAQAWARSCASRRRQSVSYTASLAHLVMGRLLVNQARLVRLPGCYVALAIMTPSPQVRTGVLEVPLHNSI